MKTCVLCGSQETALLEERTMKGTPYALYACASCAIHWWEPFRNPGASWYEHDERYADRNQDPILAPNEKHTGVLAHFGNRTGRVLDVGCGVGNFLAHAKRKGWETWGIDFDTDAISAGKRTFGLERLEVADVDGFISAHPDLRFDLITFFDVLEHLDDPNAFIKSLKQVLVPGGAIAMSMPYRHGGRWLMPHDLPPRHLTRWDEASLATFLARHGFSLVKVCRLPASLMFIVMKLRFRYGTWASFGLVRKAKEAGGEKAGHGGTPTRTIRVRVMQTLARTKDIVLFGVPALLIWAALLPTRKRYTDFYAIAVRDEA